MNIDKEFFKNNGYCIVKDVFNASEIADFRTIAYKTYEQDNLNNKGKKVITNIKNVFYPIGDLLTRPLSKILLSDKILKIADTILEATPVYFGDSTYQIGVGDRGFHRDNVDRISNEGEDWVGDYDIIRIGVYMQDHDKYSGGLKVIAGSHKGDSGKKVFVDSKAGDVVVWSLKTFHSGNAARLKIWPSLVMGYRLENKLPSFLMKDTQQERISCFMSFAKDGKHLRRYIDKYMKVKMIEHMKSSNYSSQIEEFKHKNVIIKEIDLE